MAHDSYYHEFDSEVLYRELSNYKQYLEDCKEDSRTEGHYTMITEELAHVDSVLETLRELYDCE